MIKIHDDGNDGKTNGNENRISNADKFNNRGIFFMMYAQRLKGRLETMI
jgi:hypothetical protein